MRSLKHKISLSTKSVSNSSRDPRREWQSEIASPEEVLTAVVAVVAADFVARPRQRGDAAESQKRVQVVRHQKMPKGVAGRVRVTWDQFTRNFPGDVR